MSKKRTLLVESTEIAVLAEAGSEFISLTDIARRFGEPRIVIQNWIRGRSAIELLGAWEMLHNPGFNRIAFDAFMFESGGNAFTLSPTKWVEATGAIGISSKAGRYGGGTFAHSDIAMSFCHWLSPVFHLYTIKEFQRMKEAEAAEAGSRLGWSVRRELARVNYRLHADAVRTHLIPDRLVRTKMEGLFFASEADLLNAALFGQTARDWALANPDLKGNQRDHASIEQLLVLANLESLNSVYIRMGLAAEERLQMLNEEAIHQLGLLIDSAAARRLDSTRNDRGPDSPGIKS